MEKFWQRFLFAYSITCSRLTGLSSIFFCDMIENVNTSFRVALRTERFRCQFDSKNISIFVNLTEKLTFDLLNMAESFWFLIFSTHNKQWRMEK